MIIRLNNSLVNLANMTTLEKVNETTIEVKFVDGTFQHFDCPFEDLAYHMGFESASQKEEEETLDDSSEESV